MELKFVFHTVKGMDLNSEKARRIVEMFSRIDKIVVDHEEAPVCMACRIQALVSDIDRLYPRMRLTYIRTHLNYDGSGYIQAEPVTEDEDKTPRPYARIDFSPILSIDTLKQATKRLELK